jgi:putative peptidoglycan lipid II flippase
VAAALAASIALSRVLGYAREAVLSRVLGAGAEADAYGAAFMLPDLLNHFLAGGALSIAFIPFYTRLRDREGEASAERFLAVVYGTTGAFAVAATIALWLGAAPLVALQFPNFDPATAGLTAHLTRILLPAQIFFIAGGVLRGALMARGHFVSQALAPLFYNLAIIAGGLAGRGAEGFAWGALIGAGIGAFGTAWLEMRRVPGLRIVARIDLRDASLHRYLAAALPLMLGVTLLTVDEWYDRWFGALDSPGTVAALRYARQLMLLPVAVVGQAIATAALPTLARLASEGRDAELDATLLAVLRAAVALACVGTAATFVCAEPAVMLLYEGGRFTAADTERVARLLQIFAFAIPAWIAQQIAVRGFYARGDTWWPMWLGTGVAAAAALLYLELGQRHGAVGLAAAGAISMTINAVATLVLLRTRCGGPPLGPLARSVARAGAIAAVAGLAAAALPPLGPGKAGAAIDLAARGGICAVVAAAGVQLLGDGPMRDALRAIARRVSRFRR